MPFILSKLSNYLQWIRAWPINRQHSHGWVMLTKPDWPIHAKIAQAARRRGHRRLNQLSRTQTAQPGPIQRISRPAAVLVAVRHHSLINSWCVGSASE